MTPKEKARELKDKFQKQIFFDVTDEKLDINEAKGLALLAVDEIINCDYFFNIYKDAQKFTSYWYEVQKEIQKL